MSLFENWIQLAYNKEGQSEKQVWDKYIPLEQKIYEEMLETKNNKISGTIKELGARYHMSLEYVCGFIDGISDAAKEPITVEEITEDDYIELNVDFEQLYKKMVEYKAEHLYNLPQWKNIFTEEELKNLLVTQRNSRTVVKEQKVGRNEPCTCGSGKKYKKCCGMN